MIMIKNTTAGAVPLSTVILHDLVRVRSATRDLALYWPSSKENVELKCRKWFSTEKSQSVFVVFYLFFFSLNAGFITMTPQLFINYKMKSVAHLPWRMLTYKALNTFIDDLFAFVIKMPMMYRIGCLRDGVFMRSFDRFLYSWRHLLFWDFGHFCINRDPISFFNRCSVLHLSIPEVDLQSGSQPRQWVWHERSGPQQRKFSSGISGGHSRRHRRHHR